MNYSAHRKCVNEETALEHGRKSVFQRLIAANNARLQSIDFADTREVLAERTTIYTTMIADWAREQKSALAYERPFAIVALGGTGREEMSPRSDMDVAFLFDDELEGNEFLIELQRQTVHGNDFDNAFGFKIMPLPFSFDAKSPPTGKDLNAFLDMRPIFDPSGLAPAFREWLRGRCDPFFHFLYARGFWTEQSANALALEKMGCFDIKSDALRIFQAAVWMLGAQGFLHSHAIYRDLVDEKDMAAYYFLSRMRSWLHLLRPVTNEKTGTMGRHPEDILKLKDFSLFGSLLGREANCEKRAAFCSDLLSGLLSARRRIASFARSVVERELRDGRAIRHGSPVVLGHGGLRHTLSARARTANAKSRAAFDLLLQSQRHGLPIDAGEFQSTFLGADEWIERVPDVGSLFYETRGSLADTFVFIAQIDGAEERLFPGRARFEASLLESTRDGKCELAITDESRKLRELERFIAEGRTLDVTKAHVDWAAVASPAAVANILDGDHLAAVKLALKTMHLPVTKSLKHRSGFSGIPVAAYYNRFAIELGFTPETVSATEFIVEQQDALREHAAVGWADEENVRKLLAVCKTEQRLHALFLFTCSDAVEWRDSNHASARWFVIHELYIKSVEFLRWTNPDPLSVLMSAGFAPEDVRILCDFGADFFGGLYRRHINRFGSDLVRLATSADMEAPPKAAIVREGTSLILGVAAKDFPGLAACICGALLNHRVAFEQAHFFSSINHRLALDFFHLSADGRKLPGNLPNLIEDAIAGRFQVGVPDLPSLGKALVDLQEPRPRHFRARCTVEGEKAGMLIYALCLKLHLHLQANIYGLVANASASGATITIHHSLPSGTTLEDALVIVRDLF